MDSVLPPGFFYVIPTSSGASILFNFIGLSSADKDDGMSLGGFTPVVWSFFCFCATRTSNQEL